MQPRLDESYFELRVEELPDFFLAAESIEEVMNEVTPALEAFLQTYIDAGEDPPQPKDPHVWRVVPKAKVEAIRPLIFEAHQPSIR